MKSIERLVIRAYTTWAREKGTSWTDHMRAALTEQAEAYEKELAHWKSGAAAEARRGDELQQRIRELEAQRVPEEKNER